SGHMVSPPGVQAWPQSASVGLTGEEGRFRQGEVRKSGTFLEQELSDCRVLGEADSPVEGVESLARSSGLLQQVGANRPIALVFGEGSKLNLSECREACTGPIRFGKGGGVSRACAERGKYMDELLIEK